MRILRIRIRFRIRITNTGGLNADVQAEAQERGKAGRGLREQDLRLPRDAAVSSPPGQPASLTLSSSLFSG